MLFKSKRLRSSLQCLDCSDVVYFRGNDLRLASGIVTRQLGQAMVEITDLNDATVHKRHVDQIHFKSSTDLRHQETSEGDSQLHTPSAQPTEPHESDVQKQPIEIQGHRQEQAEPTIDEALLREESCGDPDFRDRNPCTIRYSFMSSNHRSGSSTNGTPGERDIRVSTYDASAQTVT
ncbi:unnamed protein product [Echinostoma caproni]|uniref:LSM14 domain-containing protein n=1 Tax=Echinostoma caproni TaxID=27848 RepID=A0A183AUN0_9TREM|nr:unnamed protein product [Echinostoma caproni]